MEIKFLINRQIISRFDKEFPVEKSQNYLYCRFDFETNDWENIEKIFCVFTNQEYNDSTSNGSLMVELIDNKCLVPTEILHSQCNLFHINLVGYSENDNVIITTSTTMVKLIGTGSIDGLAPNINTPTVYKQLKELINKSYSDFNLESNNSNSSIKLKLITNNNEYKEIEVFLDDFHFNDYYTREEVEELVNSIPKFTFKIVETLPTSNISTSTIYLIPKSSSLEDVNLYDEYAYIDNKWEKIGDTKISLDNYYTKSEINDLLPKKVSELENDIGYITNQTNGLIYYYTKTEIDEKLGLYVSNNELNNKLLDYYNKPEVETLIDSKINTTLNDILSEEY